MGETNAEKMGFEILMIEYQTCLSDISQLDSDIWQSGSVFIGLSLAGIALLGQSSVHSLLELISLLGLSLIGIILLFIWRSLIFRWLYIIKVDFYRMAEIERELGEIWMVRYVEFLADQNKFKNPSFPKSNEIRYKKIVQGNEK